MDMYTRLLRQCLYTGIHDPIAADSPQAEDFSDLLNYVQYLQTHLVLLARGEVRSPITRSGYTGNALKELQNNLHEILRNAKQFAVGDFTGNYGQMGEISLALDTTGKALQTALSRLEQQTKDLTALSENLHKEIHARSVVEEDLRREQIQLRKLASTDPLTGLANRRHFFQLAGRELERIHRTGSHACLAMLDIDYFKVLNDSMGHAEGDKALMTLVKIITSVIRPYDLVGRYGGDEFIFLFPETQLAPCHGVLERLRSSVEKACIHSGQENINLTVSIGLTELYQGNIYGLQALDRAISKADEALYRAKGKARNCVSIA